MNATVAHLRRRALVAVRGPDWAPFLNNLLTQTTEGLAPGALRFGALLTPQGRVLHDLFVHVREDGCLLDVEAVGRDDLLRRLTMYRLRARVELAAAEGAVLAAWGDAPGAAGEGPGEVSDDPRLPALGRRWIAAEAPAGALGDDVYDAHRLALGAPGPDDWGVEATYPIEADFDLLNGIDFHKGCFVGQETTSRMKRRGTIRSRMLPLVFDGPPPTPGTEVLAGELRAGEVLSGREGRAMALLRLDRIEGAALTADGRPVRAEPPGWMG